MITLFQIDILPTTNLAMETLITIVSHIVAVELVEFRLLIKWNVTKVEEPAYRQPHPCRVQERGLVTQIQDIKS